jgi:hypothetical protein
LSQPPLANGLLSQKGFVLLHLPWPSAYPLCCIFQLFAIAMKSNCEKATVLVLFLVFVLEHLLIGWL